MSKRRRLIDIGDLHVGPETAILPPTSRSPALQKGKKKGRVYVQNELQRKMWRTFTHDMKAEAERGAFDLLMCHGDMGDGTNYRGQGDDVYIVDRGIESGQPAIARDILDHIPLRPRARKVGVIGSGYHNGHNEQMDAKVYNLIGAEWGVDMVVDFYGVMLHLRHFTPYSTVNRAGALFRDVEKLRREERKLWHIDGFIRGHVHYGAQYTEGSYTAWAVPGWQTRTPFTKEKLMGHVPEVGYLTIDVEDGRIVESNLVIHELVRDEVMTKVTVRDG